MSRVDFYEEDDAREIAAMLVEQGFEATVSREAFAGEDDDEDSAWAVVSDAPEALLELISEPADGWVVYPEDPAFSPAPIDLPREPRR